jgi:Kef-type K+ transport system membrane component KefB
VAAVPSVLINLFLVGVVACLAPLLISITHAYILPTVVLEIVGGMIIGPQVLNWVHVDVFLGFLSTMGLSYLLFLSGLEVDVQRLKGRIMILAGGAFLISFGLASLIGFGLYSIGEVSSPLLITIMLVSTSLGIVIPILKDAGESSTNYGQLVIAGATLGEFGSIILVSLLFSSEISSPFTKVFFFGVFVFLILLVSLTVLRVHRTTWFLKMLHRFQDSTSQINVRIALTLLVGFVGLAYGFGAEAILGAFLAGVVFRTVYKETSEIRPRLRVKLEAIGFGFFVPIFFITSGIEFNLHVLYTNLSVLELVPLFLIALLLVHSIPAIVYRLRLDSHHTAIAGLLQATSLTFIVAASQIGVQLHVMTSATSAALVAAGLLSVIIYPLIALALLRSRKGEEKLDEEKPLPSIESTYLNDRIINSRSSSAR